MYDTAEEARQKLEGTVVLYDNVPVYIVTATGNKNKVNLHYQLLPLESGAEKLTRSITDPLWDFRTGGTKLGYTEAKNPSTGQIESVFLSRVPIRHSRQGLDSKTIQIQQFDRDRLYNISWSDIIQRGDGLNKTVKNIFSTPLIAFKNVTNNFKEYQSVPIHRKLSLMYDTISPPYLIYRNEKVGYTEDGTLFKLAKHKQYLSEELQDMVGLKLKG